jgi:4-amino-4-deoxy-L-arabinose transferase-like glycosyltransferase
MFRRPVGPLLVALLGAVTVLGTIAPDGRGPGVTCDELYHVYQGKQLWTAIRQQGFAFFQPANIEKNFPWKPGGPPVQAPLGYWILGATHYLFDPMPDNPSVLSITAARFAPALAFTLLIFLVGVWTARRHGSLAGVVAAAAVLLMPRLFGHAHLAALDMLTTLFFVAAILAVAEAARDGRTWQFALAGAVWGSAMLVRLHGLLIAPPIILWLLWLAIRRRWGDQAEGKNALVRFVRSASAWLAAGVCTFILGWPWLWPAPLTRFHQYLASGTGRQMLHVFYAGTVWGDREAPWHYPWVMFAVTVPLGLLVLGMVGGSATLRKTWRRAAADSRPQPMTVTPADHAKRNSADDRLMPDNAEPTEGVLLAGTMAFVLAVFSWPGTPVYDGTRLFLMVAPLWAVWVGIGARRLVEQPALARWPVQARYAGLTLFLLLQGAGVALYHPCSLSYYNLLVGGLPGAARLGFEVTFWGDAVREPMLVEAACRAEGQAIFLAPNLAPFQAPAVEMTSPALTKSQAPLVGFDLADVAASRKHRYAVVYRRRADFDQVQWLLDHGRVVEEYCLQGVWLARLVEIETPLDVPAPKIRIDGLP